MTRIIIWIAIIMIWLLFCYGEVRDAYYSWENIGEDLTITGITDVKPYNVSEYTSGSSEYTNPYLKPQNTVQPKEQSLNEPTINEQTYSSEQKINESPKIRVVLLDDSGSLFHQKIVICSKNETLQIDKQSDLFQKTDRIRISLASPLNSEQENVAARGITVQSINKSYGHPCYEGTLEIHKKEEGLILINELELETYVKGVLPGEMSGGFPMEALKAQAVCARTYAWTKMKKPSYPEYNAALDDSVSDQVYMMQQRNEKTDLAVDETYQQLLYSPSGELAECFYYSTSCGKSATEEVWDIEAIKKKDKSENEAIENEFEEFISKTIDGHLEKDEPFYRWKYETDVTSNDIYEKCKQRNLCTEDYGKIKDIKITCRENGGAAECMEVICEEGSFSVMGEYNIRFVLSQGGNVILQNDKAYTAEELLPSAFLTITCVCNKKGHIIGYKIVGGGFGHGIGMSQNGAKYMAKAGNNYVEILQTYYKGSYID